MSDADDKTDKPDDLLDRGRKAYDRCVEAESENRDRGEGDIRFARASEQWPAGVPQQREIDGKPTYTVNTMGAFIRQVVNDARQNKPQIKVQPVDDVADPETAEVIGGLIRHIEVSSSADIAYDTAVECGVGNGFGYIRVVTQYAFDDTFDLDLAIKRVPNPFVVYGDPNSVEADGSDWNVAFVVERMSKAEFERQYKGKSKVDWDDHAWKDASSWRDGDDVIVAEWWEREEIEREIVQMVDGRVFSVAQTEDDEDVKNALAAGLMQIATNKDGTEKRRTARSKKVTRRVMTGVEVIDTEEWPGRYIPIAPVYGDEYWLDGKRHLKSLIHDAKDAAMMRNFWRSTATELASMTPRTPFMGPVGSFDTDREKWNTINTRNHPYVQYDVVVDETTGQPMMPPQRQPIDMGPAMGAMQEAMLANDDQKSIMGLYDASLGARSNETSGRAIMARQREGDVSTFHFIDNLARAIRHVGRILVDLIPHVYDAPRIVRILGEDGKERTVQLNQEFPRTGPDGRPMEVPAVGPDGQPVQGNDGNPLMEAIMALHDVTTGKYDVIVSTGPSFTTRREEAATLMMEFARAYPPAAPLLMDMVAKNLDWPGAEEFTRRLERMLPPQIREAIPPEVQQHIEKLEKAMQAMQVENAKLKESIQIKAADSATKRYAAETDRMETEGNLRLKAVEALRPQVIPAQPIPGPRF